MQKVALRLDLPRVTLIGGASAGGDFVHRTVSSWVGWKRTNFRKDSASIYTARLNPATALPLLSPPFELDADEFTLAHVRDEANRVAEAKAILAGTKDTHCSMPGSRQPMVHQARAVGALRALGWRAILADEMGLGKSSVALWAAHDAGARRILIVCPATVKRNWIREAEATLPYERILVDGTPKQRRERWTAARQLLEADRAVVLVLNYDLLRRLAAEHVELLGQFVTRQALILDECHYLKNARAERTRFVLEHLAPQDGGAAVRLALSGTPVRNMVDDLWAQVQCVRPGTWASRSWFISRYLKQRRKTINGRTFFEPIGTQHLDELNRVIQTVLVRRRKDEVLDLPPKVRTRVDIDLDQHTAKIYKAMRDLAVVQLQEIDESATIFSPSARSGLEALLRCEQIASGFLGGIPEDYIEQIAPLLRKAERIPGRPGELIFPNSAKLAWLTESIDTIIGQGGRPVVFSRFNAPMFWLSQQWERAAMLHGGMSSEQRDQVIERFQQNELRVLFCQVRIAEGFNLTNSQDELFFGRDWSPAINAQAEDRCHRIGTKGTVNIQIPVVGKTVEELIDRRLASKDADARQALKTLTVRELLNQL